MTPHRDSDPDARRGPAWARPVLVALAAGAALLLGAAATIAYHNLRFSYARILDILGSATTPDGLDLTTVDVPGWVAPFLQDLSVVSPSLVTFTAGRMLVAAVLLLAAPLAVRRWPALHFPFPEPYKVYYIQMGLLGTIVGFVLAFAEVDPRADRQSIILLEALGTALWSTLTAIVLAYVVCPVVEAPYRRLREAIVPREPADTRSALDLLRTRTVAAAEELDALGAATRTLAAASQALGSELQDRELRARVDRIESELQTLLRVAEELSSTQRATGDRLDALASELNAATRTIQTQERSLAHHEEAMHAVHRDLAALRSVSDTLAAEAPGQRAARARLEALEAWLRHAPRGNGEEP